LLVNQRFRPVSLALLEGPVGSAEWRWGWHTPRPPLRGQQHSEERHGQESASPQDPEPCAVPTWPALAACHRLCHGRRWVIYKFLLGGFQIAARWIAIEDIAGPHHALLTVALRQGLAGAPQRFPHAAALSQGTVENDGDSRAGLVGDLPE